MVIPGPVLSYWTAHKQNPTKPTKCQGNGEKKIVQSINNSGCLELNFQEFCAELQKPHVNVNEYNHQGDTPLHSLVKKVFKKKDSQLKFDLLLALLISSDVNVNCRNQFGRGDTALHMAVEVWNNTMMNTVLMYNISPQIIT